MAKLEDILKSFESVEKSLEKAGKKHCPSCGLPVTASVHKRVCVNLKGKGDLANAKFDKEHTIPTRPNK